MRVFAVICVAVLLSACAASTTPIASNAAIPVHASKWKTDSYRSSGENTGLLIIKRDTGFRGSACIPNISLDSESIAPLNVGEKLELHLDAGRYLISAAPNYNCAANLAKAYVDISMAKTTTYRLSFVENQSDDKDEWYSL